MRSLILPATIAAALCFAPSLAFAQKCPANARKAGFALMPAGSISPGRTVTVTHPCGRQLTCTGGRRGSPGSRACRWL